MSSFAEQISDSLVEEGVNARVATEETPTGDTTIYIRRDVGGEPLAYTFTIPDGTDTYDVQKRAAFIAQDVAEKFYGHLVDRYYFDGWVVELSVYDGGWAECLHCDAEVVVPRMSSFAVTDGGNLGEMSNPAPMPIDTESAISRMSDGSERLLRMYLLGRLREQCDVDCPNNKYSIDRKI